MIVLMGLRDTINVETGLCLKSITETVNKDLVCVL